MTVPGHVDIREAVVVVVADCNAHEERAIGDDAARLGDVGEAAVSIVAIERRLWWNRWPEERRKTAVDEKRVQPAVLVEIQPGDAGAQRLGVELLRRRR